MARQNTNYQMSLQVNMDEVKIFAQILRTADKVMYAHLHDGLLKAGQIVADEAKSNASWSTKIPGAIRTRSTVGSVSVYVDRTMAPDARPIEHGGLSGKFRHPVYPKPKGAYDSAEGGQRWPGKWTSQKARPFLTPALRSKRHEVADLVNLAVEETLAEIAKAR